jgi:prepilin-type processing-associated H-X9-DG protein
MSICATLGKTNWAAIMSNPNTYGLNGADPGGYNASREHYYYNTQGQMALNMMLVDFGPSGNTLGYPNNRPTSVYGRLGGVANPANIILGVAESTWDWGPSLSANLGNGLVWPSYPNAACFYSGSDGWTRYVHNGKSGPATAGDPNRVTTNPNLQGLAVFTFCDGHVKPMRYTEAERCAPLPNGQTWVPYKGGGAITTYYPHWIPEISE